VGQNGGHIPGLDAPGIAETELVHWLTANPQFDYGAMIQLKQQLGARLGPEAGFARGRQLVPREKFPDADRVEARLLRSLRIAAQESPVCVEVAASGRPFEIPPPRVVGQGDHRVLSGTSRALYVTCLSDARIRSASSVIDADGAAILDFEGSELVDTQETLDFEPSIFSYDSANAVAWLLTPSETRHEADLDAAYPLFGWYTGAFGHWIHEYLPKYVMPR
jgi:hypothetical protein